MKNVFAILLIASLISSQVHAGPIAVGICYAGCGGMAAVCFAAAGFTFGTVPFSVIAATPALAACNTAFAACMKACTVAFALAPTP